MDRINEHLDDINKAAPFIDFIRMNTKEFKDGKLAAFDIIVIDKNGNSFFEPADNNSFIYSDKYEEVIQKNGYQTIGFIHCRIVTLLAKVKGKKKN